MPTLPYDSQDDVKLFANEYVSGNTINRALLRLFYNDNYLANLSSLNPVALPMVANSIIVSTSPSEYAWKNSSEVKTLLGISDSMFGLSDVDALETTIEDGQGLVWNSASSAFISMDAVSSLVDLADTSINSPQNLQSLMYSDEYGKWINGYPGDFSVGYITNVVMEADGKVLLPFTDQIGQQVSVTKYNTTTDVYIVADVSNKINGQAKSLISNNSAELHSTIHLRTILRSDESIEWVTVSGDGTWEFIDTGLVPGSGIQVRQITTDDLMLQPYDITYTGAPDASESIKGMIRIATFAEATAGTAVDVCVNPLQLQYFFDNYIIPFSNDAEFKAGTDDTKAPNIAQIHSMDSLFFDVTTGSEDLTKNTNGTWTYYLDDFTGPSTDGVIFDSDQIRGVWVECLGQTSNTAAEASATWPSGNAQYIASCEAYGDGDTARVRQTILVPINRGQESFDLSIAYGSAASMTYNIIGVQQRVFE